MAQRSSSSRSSSNRAVAAGVVAAGVVAAGAVAAGAVAAKAPLFVYSAVSGSIVAFRCDVQERQNRAQRIADEQD